MAGCGLNVQSADLFLLTRTGQGTTLTEVVNDGGTIRCDGRKAVPISNQLLITARDLSDNLGTDASKHLRLGAVPGSVFSYRITVQQGTVTFADRNTGGHKELAQAELFAAQAAQQACGLN